MLKKLLLLTGLLIAPFLIILNKALAQGQAHAVYDFSFKKLRSENESIRLSDYRGKVILVVNTASHCGFTKQYAALESLYREFRDQGLIIIGVPSNDFGDQEPGSSKEIAQFCEVHYGVTFPLTEKLSVRGKNADPFFVEARKVLGYLSAPKWNFHKYLINRDGYFIDYFNSFTDPNGKAMRRAIENALKLPA